MVWGPLPKQTSPRSHPKSHLATSVWLALGTTIDWRARSRSRAGDFLARSSSVQKRQYLMIFTPVRARASVVQGVARRVPGSVVRIVSTDHSGAKVAEPTFGPVIDGPMRTCLPVLADSERQTLPPFLRPRRAGDLLTHPIRHQEHHRTGVPHYPRTGVVTVAAAPDLTVAPEWSRRKQIQQERGRGG